MIKDLYFLGVVLEKKYRLLRITYNIFMIGIIISVIAFVVALIQFGFSPIRQAIPDRYSSYDGN
jgi:hypothetical protein